MASQARAVVIGGGVGGLVAAALLADRGVRVTLVERSRRAGGKLRTEVIVGRGIEVVPTVLTMRWVFERVLPTSASLLNVWQQRYRKAEPLHDALASA